ncbi:MAG TPA: hypothetical protein VK901_12310, partial [Nitrospiraceae bacterium]|nr:hypothetical protein [Nitrospiraceae bacterium]
GYTQSGTSDHLRVQFSLDYFNQLLKVVLRLRLRYFGRINYDTTCRYVAASAVASFANSTRFSKLIRP